MALRLQPEDLAAIAATKAESTGPAGGVYALERVRSGKHASIMKYSLNRDGGD